MSAHSLTLPARTATAGPGRMSAPLMLLFAAAAGVISVTLFAAQPLIGLIGPSLGLRGAWGGAGSTLTLLGYAAGLVVLVPLTDVMENRTLILRTLAACVAALGAAALARSAAMFLAASFAIGLTACAIQMLIPIAAALSGPAERGRVVGTIGSGLMLGILLSRPAATLLAEAAGWRAVYAASAALVAVLALLLGMALPRRQPPPGPDYPAVIRSLAALWRDEKVLRASSISSALCFTALSLFWSVVALRLATPPFSLGANGIALFAFAGAGGAISAPIAGRLGDRGFTRAASLAFRCMVAGASLLAALAGSGLIGAHLPGLLPTVLMTLAAFIIDAGTIGEQTLSRRAITLLRPEAVGRMNGLFTGLFFIGGSAGSLLAAVAWGQGGWLLACALGTGFGVAALLVSAFIRI